MQTHISNGNGDTNRRPSIRKIRLSLDLTQGQMAERMGISRPTYNGLENGRGLTKNLARLVAEQTGQTIGDVWNEYESIEQLRRSE